jgi:hypothetical protein
VTTYIRAYRLVVALPLAAACAACPGQPAGPPPAPAAPPSVERAAAVSPALPSLSAVQLARLEYTFQAAELTQRDWPQMHAAETCMLLVEPTLQWVVNCDQTLPGFELTLQTFRNRAMYVHAAGSFEAAGQSQSTAQLLAKTPAAAQVPARNVPQPLPGNKPWLVVGSLEALTQFHPAFEHATTEAWVSVVIHELVHTHQLRAPGAENFVDAIVGMQRSPDALTELFLGNARYHALVEREYELLTRAAAADPTDTRAAREALQRWQTRYRERIGSLRGMSNTKQLIADDALFSYLEGVARFVESQFLADPSLQPQASLAGDDRFDHYAQFRDRGYAGSPNRQLDEHYFYAIGYHLCVLLDRVDSTWRSRVHSRERFLYDLVSEVAAKPK